MSSIIHACGLVFHACFQTCGYKRTVGAVNRTYSCPGRNTRARRRIDVSCWRLPFARCACARFACVFACTY